MTRPSFRPLWSPLVGVVLGLLCAASSPSQEYNTSGSGFAATLQASINLHGRGELQQAHERLQECLAMASHAFRHEDFASAGWMFGDWIETYRRLFPDDRLNLAGPQS